MDGDPLIQDGELIGYTYEAEDGATVVVNEAGEVVAAVDVNLEPIDPSGYAINPDYFAGYDEGGYDERAAELQAQMDALEARVDQPREIVYTPEPPRLDQSAVHEQWQYGVDRLQAALGRTLTQREIADLAQDSAQAGDYDLVAAAERRAEVGQPLLDLDDEHRGRAHEARVEHARRLLEQSEPDRPDPVTGERPRAHEVYDSDDGHRGRIELAEDLLRGHDVSGRDVSSDSFAWADDESEGYE